MRDITSTAISGFEYCIFRDRLDEHKRHRHKLPTGVKVVEKTDRVYESTALCHTVSKAAGLDDVKVCKVNLPDTIVWNPWDDKDENSVIDENEYRLMLNIAPAQVTSRVRLEPQDKWKAQVRLRTFPNSAVRIEIIRL